MCSIDFKLLVLIACSVCILFHIKVAALYMLLLNNEDDDEICLYDYFQPQYVHLDKMDDL